MRWLGVLATLLAVSCPSRAGPLEARRLLDSARELAGEHWTRQVAAYREAALAVPPVDRTHGRALKAIASRLKREGLVHGAFAFQARLAGLGPDRDRTRLGRVLDLALHLRHEGDLDAAAPLLVEVFDLARSISPRHADRALDARSDDLHARGELVGLEALVRRHPLRRAAPSVRLRIANRLGLLRLDADDRRGAERAYRQAQRLWRETASLEGREATRCARIWLDFELRSRLEDDSPP